ncbi:hypothetical protein H2204_001384 [Knufia peltigerae]|uniref:SnoaL-like domain-containing protein n=1 Tax=Knufia peltigerae TaxID=1002370 RepID=A0AA38YD58_9EURO|nr:hypothetical protein H2204_001384 [Knufia peltigerae]
MSTTTTNDQMIQRLTDESSIRDLVARFANACSPPDPSAFAKLWMPDDLSTDGKTATWGCTEPFEVSVTGVSSIVALFEKLIEPWDFFVQLVHSGVVEIDYDSTTGTGATGRFIMREVAKGPNETYYNNFAIYEDQYTKINGKWYFASRHYKYMFLDSGSFGGNICPPVVKEGWYSNTKKT